MARLFVPLDVDFATDPKMLAAGPIAGYLFLSSLALAKRTLTDGRIQTTQLPVLAVGFPGKPRTHAQRLVDVGLWLETEGGWRIAAWDRWNASKADVEAAQKIARDAGVRGNHERWHVGEDGRPSPRCPLCIAPLSGGRSVPDGVGDGVAIAKTEVETETKTEVEKTSAATAQQLQQGDDHEAAAAAFDATEGLSW